VIYPRLVYFQGLHRQQSIKSVPLPSCARFHQVQENPDGKGSMIAADAWRLPAGAWLRPADGRNKFLGYRDESREQTLPRATVQVRLK